MLFGAIIHFFPFHLNKGFSTRLFIFRFAYLVGIYGMDEHMWRNENSDFNDGAVFQHDMLRTGGICP